MLIFARVLETPETVFLVRGNNLMDYILIRSNRKTLAIQVEPDGQVIVRAPERMARRKIEEFVSSHGEWIDRTRTRVLKERENCPTITEEERKAGIEAARAYIPGRVAYFAARMGVTYGRITIREQKTRWGSCSSKGNLNFNWKLMMMPKEVLDYVVVHELAHRKEMNHSKAFWAVVEKELPDYKERRRLLKEQTIAS